MTCYSDKNIRNQYYRLVSVLTVTAITGLSNPCQSTTILMAFLALISTRPALLSLLSGSLLWLALHLSGLLPQNFVLALLHPIFTLPLLFVVLTYQQPLVCLSNEAAFCLRLSWAPFVALGLTVLITALLFLSTFRPFPVAWAGWAVLTAVYCFSLVGKTSLWNGRRVAALFLSSLLILSISLALTEIGARILFPLTNYWFHSSMIDPKIIYKPLPGASSVDEVMNNSGDIIFIKRQISSQGIYDREIGSKEDHEYRILLLGDSFTQGLGVFPEEAISSQLETLLNEEKLPWKISVINCGVRGYAPWQEREFLLERGMPLEPDLVILQLFPANDVAGSYDKVGKYLHAVDIRWARIIADIKNNNIPYRMEKWAQCHSSFYRQAFTTSRTTGLIRYLAEKSHLLPFHPTEAIVPRSSRNAYREVCLVTWYPELYEAWSIFEDSLRQIRDDCLERKVLIAGYAHGTLESLLPDHWKDLNKKHPETPYEMNKDIRLTNELLERLEIPVIHVLSSLQDYAEPIDLYNIYDGHFTPLGARLVAECLREYVFEQVFNPQLKRSLKDTY